MSRSPHLTGGYPEDRPNSEDRSNQEDHPNLDNVTFGRGQAARSPHAEHADESSESSHHSRRPFTEAPNFPPFSATQYAVPSPLQRPHSVGVAPAQFSKSVFGRPTPLGPHPSLWGQQQQEQRNSIIQQQEAGQVNVEQRVAKLESGMNSVLASIDSMQSSMDSFNRNLKVLIQREPAALPARHQTSPPTPPEYNTAHPEYNRDHTTASNGHKKHLQMAVDFKASDIGFFAPGLAITSEYPAGDVINVSKYTVYRDVVLFVQQVRRIARTSPEDIASRLHECLRGPAMQWFSGLMVELQDRICRTVETFCTRLEQKYRMSTSQAFDKLTFEHYTMSDAQKLRSVDEYIQAILRYSRAAELPESAALTIAWKNLDFELQRDVRVPGPNDDQDDFTKRLEQACELWASKSRQSAAEREEAAYQRGLKAQARQQGQQQQQVGYQQQGYQQQGAQNRQQYQRPSRFERNQVMPPPQQYNTPANATSTFGPVRGYATPPTYVPANDQKLLANTAEVVEINEDDTNGINSYFVDEEAGPVEVFFNDSAFQRGAQPPFSCMKCARRWDTYEDLLKHMVQQHQIDPDSPPYSNQVHHVVVYPPTARGYTIVQAQFPDDAKREICLDTGSMVTLTDDRIVDKLGLEIKNTKPVNLRGVGNQLTSKYVNYDIVIGNEKLAVQSYVVEGLSAGVLLGMDTIKDYNVDILTSKNRICIGNSEVPMTYGRVGGVIVNHAVVGDIERNAIQNGPAQNLVLRRGQDHRRGHDHQGTEEAQQIGQSGAEHYKGCEKHESEEFESVHGSEARPAPAGQYVGRQASKTSAMASSKTPTPHTCRRCFRAFRSNNELHEHARCTHLEHRRRRRSNDQPPHTDRRLDQPWRKL